MNLSSYFRTAKSVITANSPALLTGAAITGIVTTGILAARAGYKARGIIDEKMLENAAISDGDHETVSNYRILVESTEPLPFGQKFQLTWLTYAVPAVVGVSSIVSVAGAHLIHSRRQAALAGLYVAATTKLDDVQEKAEEMLGQKKAQVLRDHVAQKAVDRDQIDSNERFNHEVILLDGGNELMKDEFSGRYFRGSKAIVDQAVANVNIQLAESGDVSLNEFYDWVGLPTVPMGDFFGWSGTKIDVSYGAAKAGEGQAAVAFWFSVGPKDSLGRK